MLSEDGTEESGTPVWSLFAVYLDMFDTHAQENVDQIDGGGVPVGHAVWLIPFALVVSVFTQSMVLLGVVSGVTLLWVTACAAYCWHMHRRYRVAMDLPVWPLVRYWVRPCLTGSLFMGATIGGQALFRYFH